jgi:hypothetical protein
MENYTHDLKISIVELLDNLIVRIEQIDTELGSQLNATERLVYLIEDLQVLSNGMEAAKIEIDNDEYHFLLNNIANSMEQNEQYLLGEILNLELKPLLAEWKGMIENE